MQRAPSAAGSIAVASSMPSEMSARISDVASMGRRMSMSGQT